MSISFVDFQREIKHAQGMIIASKGMEKDRWRYVQHGLQRLYKGDKYESLEAHMLRLSLINSEKESIRIRGEGYRQGFEYDKVRIGGDRRGRKQVGDIRISPLITSTVIVDKLKKLSQKMEVAETEIRRNILEDGVIKLCKQWRVE